MQQNNSPYNPPQIGQPMMPSPQMTTRRMTWKQRFLSGNTGRPLTLRQERSIPNWIFYDSSDCRSGNVPWFELVQCERKRNDKGSWSA